MKHTIPILLFTVLGMLCTFACIQSTASDVAERIIELTAADVIDIVAQLGKHSCTFSTAGTIVIGKNHDDSSDGSQLLHYEGAGNHLVLSEHNQQNIPEDSDLIARLKQSCIRVYDPNKSYPALYSATHKLMVHHNMLSIESADPYLTNPYIDLPIHLAELSQCAFADIAGHPVAAYYNPAQTRDDIICVNIVDIIKKTFITRRYKGDGNVISLTFAPTSNPLCRDLAILFATQKNIELFRARCFYDLQNNLRSSYRSTRIIETYHDTVASNPPLAHRVGYTPNGSHLCIVQCCVVNTLCEFYAISVYDAQNGKRSANHYTFQSLHAKPSFTTASLSPDIKQLLIDGLLINLTHQNHSNTH